MARVVISAAVLTLVLAGRAEAAELRFFEFGGILQYAADEGEQNRLTVERPDATTVVFRDADVAVRPEGGCSAIDENSALCTVSETTIILVSLRDGDDQASAPATIAVHGEAGNDRLTGCRLDGGDGHDVLIACEHGAAMFGDAGDDVLHGGPAADQLHGSVGRDRLLGGGGDDVIDDDIDRRLPAESGDELDGGVGNDTMDYSQRWQPVAVNLEDPAGDGAAGEHDTLRSIETIVGTNEADTLIGDSGRNRLLGGQGNDLIAGGDGRDLLAGGPGADRLDGGAGNDELLTRDLFADRPRCGSGDDRLLREPSDRRASSCEDSETRRVNLVGRSVAVRPSGYALATVRCPRRSEVFGNCAGIATVYARIGNRTVRVGRGRCTICDRVLGVRLDRRGRAALRRRGRLRARVTFRRLDPGLGMLRHAEKTTFRPARGAR